LFQFRCSQDFRDFLDEPGFEDFLFAAGAEFFEFAASDENLALCLIDGAVVGPYRQLQALAKLVEVFGHGGDAFVKFEAEATDIVGVF
jgi:hypothetical protein